ncbi:MAG: glycosyltransferase [Kiritimatiellaeota bacterium]|nr:glycosyltransferase [Kiritimatiellota bacterium]
MLQAKTIAVIVPCFNEQDQIVKVLSTMPDFVDLIVVINDKSTDATAERVREFIRLDTRPAARIEKRARTYGAGLYDHANNLAIECEKAAESFFIPVEMTRADNSRVVLLSHTRNGGKGAGVASGFKFTRDHDIDCTAIMDGDGQMNPAELESICLPIVTGKADYVKGNRFKHRMASRAIPKIRFYGNATLSILTKVATGYWRVADTQTGYAAISLECLDNIEIHRLYGSYGVYNDLLQKLNIANFTITEVPITPVYNIGEKSKMKIMKVIPRISRLLVCLFFERLFKKYLYTSFHPLFLLYMMSFVTFLVSLPFVIRFLYAYFALDQIWFAHMIVFINLLLFSFQSLIFAMWFDINDNDRLYV